MNCLTEEYIRAAREMTEARDILLMIDEVQTGNGRTGKLYSYQHFGIQPDVVSTAKGLAGGLPMGACLLSEKAADVLTPGTHGSTFGGNPVCACGGPVCAGPAAPMNSWPRWPKRASRVAGRTDGSFPV